MRGHGLPYELEHADHVEQLLEQHAPDEMMVTLSLTDDVYLRSYNWARLRLGIRATYAAGASVWWRRCVLDIPRPPEYRCSNNQSVMETSWTSAMTASSRHGVKPRSWWGRTSAMTSAPLAARLLEDTRLISRSRLAPEVYVRPWATLTRRVSSVMC